MIWLPRLIDKVRAFRPAPSGPMPGPRSTSPSWHLRLTPAWIESVVRDMTSDEAIGATLRQRIPLSDEIQTRCAAFQKKYWWALAVLDRDDGYVRGLGIRFHNSCNDRSGGGINVGPLRKRTPPLSDGNRSQNDRTTERPVRPETDGFRFALG